MKKLLSIILFALLCCYAMAYDFSAVCSTGQTLYYNITSDVEPYTVEVTSENADGFYTTYPTGDLEIPETVEYNSITYSVTRIGDKAFNGCGELTSVSIPNSVTSIGEYAFEDCTELTSVTIPNSVTSIDSYAFLYCNGLETIIIGSGVTNIGTDAFAGCSILTSISVEESNSTFDSRDNCNAIIQTETNILVLGCKNTTIPNSVTSIGEDAFYGSDLESITIPNSVTTIADGAFSNCKNLTEITIPESVTSIGIYRYVFSECVALESIIVDANNTTYDSRDNCNAIIETETNTLIAGCKGTIIPNSVENISHAAFMGSGLRKVYIPNSVTNIANEVFYGCRSLTSVTIGSSVTEIGELAFYDCVNITEINLSTTTPPALGENVFTETIYNSATVWVPRGSGGIYMNTEFWTQFSTIREVPYYWLCNFEDEETWTLGNDQQDGNVQWQILTPETYPSGLISGDNAYIKPFVFNGDTLSNTPYHWAMADLFSQMESAGGPGQVAESSWIEFSWIDLSEAAEPQITFRQIFKQLNGVETSIRVSTDGGQTWTDHIVNEEVEDNTYGEYEIRTGIREAAGEGNVKIRFLINSDAHVVQMGYGWEIDDIEIKEAPDTIIATAGEGGTISPNGEVLVDIGESVTFTITPNDGYRIASVMVDGTENVTDQLVDGTYTFVDVIENHTIAATFEEIHTYTIIVLSNNDAYGMVSEGGTFEEGAVFEIAAMPNDGYRFVSWNDGNAENPRTITVTSDSTFVANFVSDSIFSTITESFEPYELGSYMSEVAAPRWELWTDGALGGLVSDEQAHYGIQSMKVYKNGSTETDVVLNVNDLTAGRYKVEFYMYVPVDNTGYYNILQDNDGSNSKYGIQLTFNDSIVTIDANGKQDATNTYIPESWIKIQQYIDLDNDWSELYLNDALVAAYQWSKGQYGNGTTCKFDAIDFYSHTINNQAGLFYIDDITISQAQASEAPTGLTAIVQNEFDVLLSWTAVDNDNLVFYSVSLDGEEIATTTETTYIDEHLYPDVYNYQVRAYYGQEIGYSAAANAQATIEGSYERESILVEMFAYKSCGYSPYAAKALDDMEAAGTFDIIVLDQHITDTYGYTESNNRFNYWAGKDNMYGQNYGFDGTPSTVFDGYVGLAGADTQGSDMQDAYTTYYNNVKAIKSIYSLTAEFEQTEFNGRTFSLNVTAEKHSEYFGDDQIVVMAALAEDIDYDWSVAGKINNLVRVLYPDANGTEATFDGNNRFSTSFSITISEEYDISKCKVVVWVENHTQGRVMQSKRFNVMDFYNLQAQQYTITVLSNNDAYGTVSGGGTYNDGDIATIMAMPNGGYLFDSWEDDNAENPRTITVTSDSTFVADFVKCEITQAIDTVVPNFVTVGEHTFYSTGNYSFSVLSENDCDTIFDIRLRVLAEPVYDIGPNPTKSLLNINSDGFISAVEFYSVTGQLVMRKEVNGYEAEFDMEGLVDGVYILRIYGEESSLPSVSKVVKE